jgi:hypothetical protein
MRTEPRYVGSAKSGLIYPDPGGAKAPSGSAKKCATAVLVMAHRFDWKQKKWRGALEKTVRRDCRREMGIFDRINGINRISERRE